MSDSNSTTTSLEYRGTTITVDSDALAALRDRVGLSQNAILAQVKSNIDWAIETDGTAENVTITADSLGDDD